jgi:hypothetical protein
MIIPGQFGLNYPSGFREEAFWDTLPIGFNVKLSPAIAAILNFISEQKNFNFVEDLPMIIPGHLVSIVEVVPEKKEFETF